MAPDCSGWATSAFAAAAIVLLGWPANAAAQTVTEYPIPRDLTAPYFPVDITVGPDGALWFTEDTQGHAGTVIASGPGKIGRITTAGDITEFTLSPPVLSQLTGIAAGPDGALWFTEYGANQIGRITTEGAITVYPISTPSLYAIPTGIATGPDGALWFAYQNMGAGEIGRITTAGAITEFPIAAASSDPEGITAGPDSALWFTDNGANQIGRISTSGTVTEYPVPTASAGLNYIALGADGALWFTEGSASKIGRITTSGTVTEFGIPTASSRPAGITAAADGAVWFAETGGNKIGRITMSGTITEYPLPEASSSPAGIAAGPDGALWFTELVGRIGRITTPSSTSPLVAAVLPSSRSVEVGNTATAFVTIINSGSSALSGCAIVPVTPVPASFVYQTTNPATNALTGSPNTPVSIAADASQTFVIALMPNAPVVPTQVGLGFDCAGVDAAPSTTGLDTLLYSASSTPVPDIVALAATALNDGILHITGTTGSKAFAVATVNVGANAAITASANTGAASLPLSITLCQTDPASGQCISPVGPNATFTINANATPTVAIFATASGSVPFVPQTNRIFVTFSDAGDTVRGSTSVAVETQ